jgi:tRNA G18 (ribose-2'-O)-methylase SpoU
MVFGSEGVGITQEMRELCEEMVYIPQFGSVRSVNCATASGIIMNSFVSQYRKNN